MIHPRDWYVEIAGQGPDLVLLHGLGASSFSWRHNRAFLSRHFRVITPDLPGHGRSPGAPGRGLPDGEPPPGRPGFSRLARYRDPRPGRQFPGRRPEPAPGPGAAGPGLGPGAAGPRRGLDPGALRLFAPAPAGPGVRRRNPPGTLVAPLVHAPGLLPPRTPDPRGHGGLRPPLPGPPPPSGAAPGLPGQLEIRPLAEIAALLRGLTQPTALIWGAQDLILPPAQGRWMKAHLPQAEFHLLPSGWPRPPGGSAGPGEQNYH